MDSTTNLDSSGAVALATGDTQKAYSFWDSLAETLGGALGSVTSNAINSATASANQAINKKFPTANAPATSAPTMTTTTKVVIGVAAVVLGFIAYKKFSK